MKKKERTMKNLLIVVLLLSVIGLNANVQKVVLKGNEIELSFENVKIGKIEFIKGEKMIVDCKKDEAVNIEEVAGKFIIFSEMEVKINLKLPENKTYLYTDEDVKITFNAEKVKLIADDGTEVDFIDGELFVNSENENVQIGKNGIIVNDKDEFVEVSSRGIIVESPDETQHITGFWGQLLGGAINFITKHSIGWIGNNPGFIVKHIINDDDYAGGIKMNLDFSDGDKITKEFHETFNPIRGCKLNVHNRNGKVEIKRWKENYIDISAILGTNESEKEFEKIKIEVLDEDGCTIKTTALEKNPKVSVQYEIKVPKGVKIGEINSSNGTILIIDCEGEMNLNTSNGRIEVFDSNGNFVANSSNGGIEFVHLNGKAEAYTSNGKIRVVRTPGFRKGVTSNGKITLEIDEKMKNDIYLSTSNGSIKLYFSDNVNAEITAKTSNSKIKLHDFEMSVSSLGQASLEGKIGDGGKKLDVQTSNGSINFYKIAK
ncbi:MAG: hypothetical protein HN334_05625 [Candidatus Cloacimonetes bacterium]|nr:hypothetical protein [Candidatus Cloacimonadota bacterium]